MPKVVVLDPGHGQDTPGKRSPDGTLREYEFNGDVALRAKRLLEARGVKVVLTRPCTLKDQDVPLSKRVAIAHQARADLFVSIHANAHGNGREWTPARGYEVYVYALGGDAHRLAQRLVDEAERLIAPAGVPIRKPPIKVANFCVIRRTSMPAVLIEHGFMTNKDECAILKSDSFRARAAEHIARAVCAHLGIRYDQPAAAPKPAAAEKEAAGKPVLRRGDTGAAVRELQEALKRLGHDPGPVDGVFGAKTEAAVKAFQRAAGIAVDGVVGPVTWSKLEAALEAKQQPKEAPKAAPAPKAPANPKPAPRDDGKLYRVVIGSFEDRQNAEALKEEAREKGFPAWIDEVEAK